MCDHRTLFSQCPFLLPKIREKRLFYEKKAILTTRNFYKNRGKEKGVYIYEFRKYFREN